MFIKLYILLLFVGNICTLKHLLTDNEYYRMPAVNSLDKFHPCLSEPGSLYCLVDADLYSEKESDLMRMIHEYSSVTTKHFNHSQIHRGVCVTKSCQKFVKGRNLSLPQERDPVIDECLNHTISKDYEIQAKLTQVLYCKEHGNERAWNISDRAVVTAYLLLIMLNVAGTFYDKFGSKKLNTGNPYLLAFSVPRNWNKLTAPSGGPDPRLNRLTAFNGFRSMTMMLVIMAHAVLVLNTFIDNTFIVEKNNYSPSSKLIKGTVVVYTFSVMSSFLLGYNLSIATEERNVSWRDCLKIALWRYLRLTPAYALVLATAATLWRHMGDGPLWETLVVQEAASCRQDWWTHLLYTHNYMSVKVPCLLHTWYLATDFQMFGVALFLYLLLQNHKYRKTVLLLTFVTSLAIPAAQTYYQDLDALFLYTPQKGELFWKDKTFYMHKGGHTNMAVYMVGLAAGLFAYHLQRSKDIEDKFKKYHWVPSVAFLLGLAVVASGSWFNSEEGRRPLALRVVYAALFKPFYATCVVAGILSCMFKVTALIRSVLEWRGFTWTARVSYSAFLVHTLVLKTSIGSMTSLLHISGSFKLIFIFGAIAESLLFGVLLYIFVESPTNALLKSMVSKEKTKTEKTL